MPRTGRYKKKRKGNFESRNDFSQSIFANAIVRDGIHFGEGLMGFEEIKEKYKRYTREDRYHLFYIQVLILEVLIRNNPSVYLHPSMGLDDVILRLARAQHVLVTSFSHVFSPNAVSPFASGGDKMDKSDKMLRFGNRLRPGYNQMFNTFFTDSSFTTRQHVLHWHLALVTLEALCAVDAELFLHPTVGLGEMILCIAGMQKTALSASATASSERDFRQMLQDICVRMGDSNHSVDIMRTHGRVTRRAINQLRTEVGTEKGPEKRPAAPDVREDDTDTDDTDSEADDHMGDKEGTTIPSTTTAPDQGNKKKKTKK